MLSTASSGFTIPELIITLALAAIVFSAAGISLAAYRQKVFFEDQRDKVLLALDTARNKSMVVESGLYYGVIFTHDSFSLVSYSADDTSNVVENYPLSSSDYYFGVAEESSLLIPFSKLTGYLREDVDDPARLCLFDRHLKVCLSVNRHGAVISDKISKI